MIAVGLMSILLAVVTCVVHLDLFGIFTSRPVHVERLVINDNYMWIPRPGTQTDIQNSRFPYNHEKQEYDDFNPYDGCTMVDLPEGVEPASIQPNEIFDVSDFERVNSDSPDYEDEDF